MNFAYIDCQNLSKAEKDIKDFFVDIEIPIKYKNFDELVAINPKHEKQISRQFEYIVTKHSGSVKNLMDKIEAMKHDHQIELLKCQMELQKERSEKELKDEIIEKMKVSLENKDLKYELLKMSRNK